MDLKWYAKVAHFLGFGYQKIKIIKEGGNIENDRMAGEEYS